MNSDLSPGDNGPFRDKLYKPRLLNLVKELGVGRGGRFHGDSETSFLGFMAWAGQTS